MHRLGKTLLTLTLLALAPVARALPNVTQEVGALWGVYGSSFTGVTSKTVDAGGYGTVGYSSVTANLNGFRYWIYPAGGNATFQVAFTTKTPSAAAAFVVPGAGQFASPSPHDQAAAVAVLSTTTFVTVPAGVAYPGTFEAQVKNPVFYFSSLSAAATYYFLLDYSAQQRP